MSVQAINTLSTDSLLSQVSAFTAERCLGITTSSNRFIFVTDICRTWEEVSLLEFVSVLLKIIIYRDSLKKDVSEQY